MNWNTFLLASLIFISTNAFASRFGANQNRSSSNSSAPTGHVQDWPGHWACQQCAGNTASQAGQTQNAPGCWNYEITINQYESERRALITVLGPNNTNAGYKALVSSAADLIELKYTEPVDSSTTASNLKRDDVLLTMQHRDGDTILRFKSLPSMVEGQSAITCAREH